MAAITGIVVYSSVLFGVGHNVRRWADSVQRTYTEAARAAAPINKRPNTGHGPPGGLKAGIHGRVDRIGPNQLETIIASDAYYTTWVLFGTRGQITSHSGGPMNLPPNMVNGTYRDQRPYVVRGQRSQNFFAAAEFVTRASHPSIRTGAGSAFRSHMV